MTESHSNSLWGKNGENNMYLLKSRSKGDQTKEKLEKSSVPFLTFGVQSSDSLPPWSRSAADLHPLSLMSQLFA